ncbi:MAG: metal ABC transporter permease [Bacteroidetes bacterium]|nr:metal ABC transporter permease [Bacteroidota bacterium]MBL0137648.1 metal ABC transporter permease [Bacteroidota bacterium]
MFEMFQLDFITQAFILSIIVGIVLSYLGVHVVGRGIVFVDLALGQITSLGVAYSDFIGKGKTFIPILFAILGAFLMSLINIRDRRLKLEAIIGIIYAVASAATVMLISKTPHGDSDIQEVLFGNILSVSWEQIKITGIVLGAIALLHAIFYKKFFALTERFEKGEGHSIGIFNLWNFLFYISIGLSIVFSVRISGVIPVFSFLIIPAVGAIMLAKQKLPLVILAIFLNILGALFGLYVSYKYDFPAGSSIVAVLGGLFLIVSIFYIILQMARRRVN